VNLDAGERERKSPEKDPKRGEKDPK